MSESLHSQIDQILRENENELIELHRALVRIPTVNGTAGGQERPLAEFAAAYLSQGEAQAAGEPELGLTLIDAAPGRTSLVASAGQGQRSMLWMSHSDVVPAGDPQRWTWPPFSAALEDGRIWGRGANDCKMLAAAQLFAFRHLRRAGALGAGRLRVIVAADEEAGGHMGFGHLVAHHPELLHADLALCEGGGSALGSVGGTPVIALGTGEKGRYEIVFTATGPGGHASNPWGKFNPVSALGQLTQRLAGLQARVCGASPVFEALAQVLEVQVPATASELERVTVLIEQARAQLPGLTSLTSQSRMTLAPTVVTAGDPSCVNAIPTQGRLICDARLLPGQTQGDLEAFLSPALAAAPGVEMSLRPLNPASASPADEKILTLLGGAAGRALGQPVIPLPVWCAGATDAHWVRALGTPVYGFQLISPAADPARLGIHCIDESIQANMLLPCAQSLAHAAAAFLC